MIAMNWSRPLNARRPGRLDARRQRALGQLRGRPGLPRADLHDPVARLQPGPLGRRLRVDVPDLDPRLRVVAHQEHAQEAGVDGRQGGRQLDVLVLLDLVPALHLEGHRLALVLGPERCAGAGPGSGPACRRPRRRCRRASGPTWSAGVFGATVSIVQPMVNWSGSAEGDPEHPGLERYRLVRGPRLQLGDDLQHVLERDGEPDPDVVPLEPGRLLLATSGRSGR